MFRDLIPLLADRFRLIAPDLPGFGQSSQPPREKFAYSFDNLAKVIDRFTETIGLTRYAIYVFDYGAPIGFRLAVKHAERITAIITQNGNAYLEGVSEAFNPIQTYWKAPNQKNRDALRGFLAPETTLLQYTHGVGDPSRVSPDGRSLDDFYLARAGNTEIQLDLFLDYQSNIAAWRLPVLFPHSSTAAIGGLGQERPVLRTGRRRSLPARYSRRRDSVFRHWSLCSRDARPRDRQGDGRFPHAQGAKKYLRHLSPNAPTQKETLACPKQF